MLKKMPYEADKGNLMTMTAVVMSFEYSLLFRSSMMDNDDHWFNYELALVVIGNSLCLSRRLTTLSCEMTCHVMSGEIKA